MAGPMTTGMDDLCAQTQEVDTAMGRSDSVWSISPVACSAVGSLVADIA